MSPLFKVWADAGWWLRGQKCCYFRVRPRHMATCLWLRVLSPLLCTYSSSHLQTLIFHPQNNLSFLFWANSRFGSPHSSSCGQLCVYKCVCVLNPRVPAQSAATTVLQIRSCYIFTSSQGSSLTMFYDVPLWATALEHQNGRNLDSY